MTDDRQVLAIRIRELDHMSEHIDPAGLTLRLADMAIEASGLEMGDVLDLYTKIEAHATAHKIAVLSSRQATDEELRGFVQSKSIHDYLVPNPETGKFEPAAIEEEQAQEPQLEPEQAEVEEDPPDLTPEAKVAPPEPAPQVEGEADSKPVCKRCGESKDQEEFSRNRWGYTSVCTECRSGKQKPEFKDRADYCVNGEDCVAFESTGQPTKLARDNKGGECGGCVQADQQRMRRGEKKRSSNR